MKTLDLKWVRILSKDYKKHVLINPSNVNPFYEALTAFIDHEILVINTNIGVDIYFYQQEVSKTVLETTFRQFASDNLQFKMQIVQGQEEVERQIEKAFLQLAAMPLLFKSYTFSLCDELNTNFLKAESIILILFDLWHSVLFKQSTQDHFNKNVHHFLNHLQQLYNDKNFHPLLKELIKSAIDTEHHN